MAELQTTYTESVAPGYPGMVANGETSNRISRTCEDSGGIGFGKAVYRGSGDHGCTATQALVGAGSAAATGNVGTSTITASPTVGAGAKIGRYSIIQLTTSGTGELQVLDPEGREVAQGVVGTAITTIPGITSVTVTGAGTPTAGDTFYIDVTGNAFLGITVATSALGLTSGQTADKYQQYDNVTIMPRGAIFVTLGGTVADGDPVGVDSSGDFVTGSGVPLAGWYFDQTGVDDAVVIIAKR
jgi:hypothetical protein